jgi:hypothetical protein
MKILKNTKKKLNDNSAMIIKSDKDNSIVIIKTHDYNQTISDLISTNKFNIVNSDPTNKFKTKIRTTIKESNYLIQQSQKWKYINLNSTAPIIKGLIKIHKPDHTIRPIVNWKNAPAYKLAKLFNNILNELSPFLSYSISRTLPT